MNRLFSRKGESKSLEFVLCGDDANALSWRIAEKGIRIQKEESVVRICRPFGGREIYETEWKEANVYALNTELGTVIVRSHHVLRSYSRVFNYNFLIKDYEPEATSPRIQELKNRMSFVFTYCGRAEDENTRIEEAIKNELINGKDKL